LDCTNIFFSLTLKTTFEDSKTIKLLLKMIQFTCKPFADLTVYELYDIMALRQEIFVIEQNCPYLDADGKDLKGWHLMGRQISDRNAPTSETQQEGMALVVYTRLLPKGVSYDDYASIGRVVSSTSVRGSGAGKILMQQSIEMMEKLFPNDPVKIGAQTYLLKFYESLGFESTGEEYLEDDIPHTIMILKKIKK
jgi:ElaA protein